MQCHLVNFASDYDATVTCCWKTNVTHVIAATDGKGACKRTLKVLMAILNGRWILTMDCKLHFLLQSSLCRVNLLPFPVVLISMNTDLVNLLITSDVMQLLVCLQG